MAGKVKELTDGNFDATVSEGITFVDFWAPWCGPCQAQGPIVEKLAEKFDGKAVIAKLNVDEQPQSAMKYNVSGIPTMVVLKNGTEVKRFVGLNQEATLSEAIEAFI